MGPEVSGNPARSPPIPGPHRRDAQETAIIKRGVSKSLISSNCMYFRTFPTQQFDHEGQQCSTFNQIRFAELNCQSRDGAQPIPNRVEGIPRNKIPFHVCAPASPGGWFAVQLSNRAYAGRAVRHSGRRQRQFEQKRGRSFKKSGYWRLGSVVYEIIQRFTCRSGLDRHSRDCAHGGIRSWRGRRRSRVGRGRWRSRFYRGEHACSGFTVPGFSPGFRDCRLPVGLTPTS
jgi:hypothetical protein